MKAIALTGIREFLYQDFVCQFQLLAFSDTRQNRLAKSSCGTWPISPNDTSCNIRNDFVFYNPHIHSNRKQRITPSTGFTRSIADEE